jgi:hypothetical protein
MRGKVLCVPPFIAAQSVCICINKGKTVWMKNTMNASGFWAALTLAIGAAIGNAIIHTARNTAVSLVRMNVFNLDMYIFPFQFTTSLAVIIQ